MESVNLPRAKEEISKDLRRATCRIQEIIRALLPQGMGIPCAVASPQQMSDLLSELMRAGQRLRTMPAGDPELQHEVWCYRKEVEHLQSVLPSIQSTLSAERDRLQQRRERVNAAAAWAQASRETLQK